MDFSNKYIIHVKTPKIEYIQFKELLKHGIINAYTLKKDGINFRSNSIETEYSYKTICDELKIKPEYITKGFQKHTSNVQEIERVMSLEELKDTDGLITNKKNIALSTTNADCNLIMLYDINRKVIANVHAGWRGTFKKIIENAVIKMINDYNCNPNDIIACFCPSIRQCHFEVEEDVKNECEEIFSYTGKLEEIIKLGRVEENKQKYNINTVLINKILMESLGIKKENIIDCNICSMCNSDYINSYRAQKESFKLSTAIIMMQ